MKKIIAWEPWYDIDPYELRPATPTIPAIEDEDYDFMSSMPDSDSGVGGTSFAVFPGKINTPLGYYPSDDNMLPTKLFDCWIGNTNFPITQREQAILNETPGVESLRIISKYRFFIGVGKLFAFKNVRSDIQKLMCPEDKHEDIDTINYSASIVDMLIDSLGGSTPPKKWAVFIGDDGNIEAITIDDYRTEEEYQKSLVDLKCLENGNIIIYNTV